MGRPSRSPAAAQPHAHHATPGPSASSMGLKPPRLEVAVWASSAGVEPRPSCLLVPTSEQPRLAPTDSFRPQPCTATALRPHNQSLSAAIHTQ